MRAAASFLLVFLLVGCGTSVTNHGAPVTSQALITAAQTVHVTEVAMATTVDAFTSAYQAGRIPRDALQVFQATYAPKIQAALAAAKVALQTWQTSPGQSTEALAVKALAGLALELEMLEGFWRDHPAIQKGVAP